MLSIDFWVSLVTLAAMEVVLGIDNVVFLAILRARVPPGFPFARWPRGRRRDSAAAVHKPSATHAAKASAGAAAMKFVTGASPPASRSVPPTICFTTPLCRSMHGRKRIRAGVRYFRE